MKSSGKKSPSKEYIVEARYREALRFYRHKFRAYFTREIKKKKGYEATVLLIARLMVTAIREIVFSASEPLPTPVKEDLSAFDTNLTFFYALESKDLFYEACIHQHPL